MGKSEGGESKRHSSLNIQCQSRILMREIWLRISVQYWSWECPSNFCALFCQVYPIIVHFCPMAESCFLLREIVGWEMCVLLVQRECLRNMMSSILGVSRKNPSLKIFVIVRIWSKNRRSLVIVHGLLMTWYQTCEGCRLQIYSWCYTKRRIAVAPTTIGANPSFGMTKDLLLQHGTHLTKEYYSPEFWYHIVPSSWRMSLSMTGDRNSFL